METTHRCHLEGWPPNHLRSVCTCGWAGEWVQDDGAAAVDAGIAHQTAAGKVTA